jgi:NAD(P)-dependent dehydrogenase (short-subunit alcohol dehydrogenase family)
VAAVNDALNVTAGRQFGLEGRVIVVTGAASGIGRVVAEHLLEEGAVPVLLDRQTEPLGAASAHVHSYSCDVTDPDALHEVFARIEAEVGLIHGAVASAGVRNFGRATSISAADWRHVIDINLNGVFYTCAEAGRACVRNGGGAIVTLSSVAAFGGLPERANYCAAKAGVVSLAKTMAIELAPQGVRVNTVAPGSVETPLASQNSAAQRARMIERTPMGRLALPREVSNVVLFLLSDLSSYVTGETILADGGWSAALM